MRWIPRRGADAPPSLIVLSLLALLGLAGCGSEKAGTPGTGSPVKGQQKGGTLRVLSNEGFQHLDPGQSYFQLDYQVVYATQRPLYSYRPEDPRRPVADLADGAPKVTDGGRTVTVRIRPGIRYSPGTVNRAVESRDVKYAVQRAFGPAVQNGYAGTYFADVRGAEGAKGGPIAGIETPDARTIVFRLTKPTGATLAQALVLPISVPVPEEYAKAFDARTPSTYDTDPTKQAFTGPYVVSAFRAGRSLTLARNRAWQAGTDFRPAYLDRVEWTTGADAAVAGRQILTGRGLVNGDTPPAAAIKLAATKYPKQITFTAYGNRYVTLNTQAKPFDDLNVRRAVNAVMDKRALQATRGGPLTGDIATHLLPPTVPGFDEAGGTQGPDLDFVRTPEGDPALAKEYLKKAGFADGRYSGPPITMLGDSEDPADKTAQVVLDGLQSLGFEVRLRLLSHDAFLDKCSDTAQLRQIAVCANYGWLPDFADGQAMLDPTFDGRDMPPVNNPNGALLDDPAINAQIARAQLIADPGERAKAWGEVDRMVTATAATVPWFWDKVPNIESRDVQGVVARWNAAFDLSFTSLKR